MTPACPLFPTAVSASKDCFHALLLAGLNPKETAAAVLKFSEKPLPFFALERKISKSALFEIKQKLFACLK
jgi:hypothetical protein